MVDRTLMRPAAIAAAGLVGLIGLIWLLGGFRPALPDGPAHAPDEPIDLQRWTIAVQRAEHVGHNLLRHGDGAVRAGLAEHHQHQRSHPDPASGAARLGAGGRRRAAVGRAGWGQLRGSSSFDPDVPVELAYEFAWTAGGRAAPGVAVVVRNEVEARNFVVSDNWLVTRPAATVRLACPDARQRA